jgi:hypothetical protein
MQIGVTVMGLNGLISTRMVSQRGGSIKINNTIENQDGTKVIFEGELSGPELAYVVQTGLNVLMYANLLPNVITKPKDEELH